MINLVVGFVLGVAVCTVGFSGLARMADRGVEQIQETVKGVAQ
jgi:hypothetical protein